MLARRRGDRSRRRATVSDRSGGAEITKCSGAVGSEKTSPSPGGGGSTASAAMQSGWGDLSDNDITPPRSHFVLATLPLQGRVRANTACASGLRLQQRIWIRMRDLA